MKIYHYTNLESLALILKNKTIRFNRLDKVDVLEEGNVESLGVKFCKYVFASCWTESEEESIPLWKMYGGDFGGVRISMEKEMFKEYIVSNLNFENLKTQGSILSIIPPQDYTKPDFFIYPFWGYANSMFYRKITYVDDINKYIKDAIQITKYDNGKNKATIKMGSFGSYKNKRWKFQDESRFVLYILPLNPLIESQNPDMPTNIINCLLQNKSLLFSHYDMHLKDEIINTMEITLSPSVTDAQRVIIEALRDKYIPQAKIIESSLGKVIRLK